MDIARKQRNYFIPAIILIATFITNNESVRTHAEIIVPHINGNALLLIVLILSVAFTYSVFLAAWRNKPAKVDFIMILLFIRILALFIPTLWSHQYAWGNIIAYFISFLTYFIFKTQKITIDEIYGYIKLLTVILIVQALVLFIQSPVRYGDTLYKYYFVAPIGASNYFAAVLSILLFIVFFKESGTRRLLWISMGVVALFLTKSRSALILLICAIIYNLAINALKGKKITLRHIYTIVMFVIFVLAILIVFKEKFSFYMQQFLSGYTQSYTGASFLDTLSSGRITLLIYYIKASAEHVLLGNGLAFSTAIGSPHNVIVEILYVNGIVGIGINMAILLQVYGCSKKNSNFISKSLFRIALYIIILALIEKVLFTSFGEFLFWAIVGCLCCEHKLADNSDLPYHLCRERTTVKTVSHKKVLIR